MTKKQRIKELEYELYRLDLKMRDVKFLNISDSERNHPYKVDVLKEKLDLLFDYLDVEIKKEPAKEYLGKKDKQKKKS